MPSFTRQDGVCHPPVACHPTHGGFNPDADGRDPTSGRVRRRGEFPATRCLLRWDERAAQQEKALEALLLIQATAGWQGRACPLCQALIRGFPCTGVAQDAHGTGRVAHEEGCARVALLRTAGIFGLLLRVFRPREWSCGPIMNQRAEGAEASVGGLISLAATSSAVRAGSRSWAARACVNTGGSRGIHVCAGDGDIPQSCPCPAWMGCCCT